MRLLEHIHDATEGFKPECILLLSVKNSVHLYTHLTSSSHNFGGSFSNLLQGINATRVLCPGEALGEDVTLTGQRCSSQVTDAAFGYVSITQELPPASLCPILAGLPLRSQHEIMEGILSLESDKPGLNSEAAIFQLYTTGTVTSLLCT